VGASALPAGDHPDIGSGGAEIEVASLLLQDAVMELLRHFLGDDRV
jgi:hypothetical protein